jgi:acyl-coenzyme A thioesterase PaaI-like protein
MDVLSRQRNSRMCAICGLDNLYGVQAPFYNMADGSVVTLFQYKDHHQSYPGRVRGGLISAMIDEMGLRGQWAKHQDETLFGVTMTLDTKYRKPVPYGVELLGRGFVTAETARAFEVDSFIYDRQGTLLANGHVKYMKLAPEIISAGADVHEEMPYAVEDGIRMIEV